MSLKVKRVCIVESRTRGMKFFTEPLENFDEPNEIIFEPHETFIELLETIYELHEIIIEPHEIIIEWGPMKGQDTRWVEFMGLSGDDGTY